MSSEHLQQSQYANRLNKYVVVVKGLLNSVAETERVANTIPADHDYATYPSRVKQSALNHHQHFPCEFQPHRKRRWHETDRKSIKS